MDDGECPGMGRRKMRCYSIVSESPPRRDRSYGLTRPPFVRNLRRLDRFQREWAILAGISVVAALDEQKHQNFGDGTRGQERDRQEEL